MPPPPIPVRIDRKPIIYSALVYPGTGQYMAGRPLIGLAFAAGFTIAFGIFLVFFIRYFHEVITFVRTWWAGTYQETEGTPSPRQMLMPLVYVLVVYVANVYDVTWHLYRPHLEHRAKAGATQP